MTNLFERIKPIETVVLNDNGDSVKIINIPDRSIHSQTATNDILSHRIYTTESNQMRVLSDKALFTALIERQNARLDDILDNDLIHYGITYNEGVTFYVHSLIQRFNDEIAECGVSVYCPHTAHFNQYIRKYVTKDPILTVNGVTYSTEEDIARVVPSITDEDTVRGNSPGFRARIPYMTTEQFFDKALYTALQASVYGEHDDQLSFLLIEAVKRLKARKG